MATLKNDDCLLVGRNNVDYQVSYQELVGSLEGDIDIPAEANDGKLTIKNSDGSEAGSFTANQAGNTTVNLPAGFSGSYNDLTNKPAIGDGTLTIKNSDNSTAGTFTANQAGATNITLPKGFSGDYNDLTNKPSAFSGDYNDLTNKPSIPAAANDGKLTIKNSDGSEAGSFTANQAGNTTVSLKASFSGNYNDLTNKPSIPAAANNGKLTIKNSDGSEAGSFTANQSGNTTVSLKAGFSGNYNDLTNKPDLTKYMPLDLRTLPTLS